MTSYLKFSKRVVQMHNSLLSEGHLYVGSNYDPRKDRLTMFYRHGNGRRLRLVSCYPVIDIIERGKKIHSESVVHNQATATQKNPKSIFETVA